MEIFQHIGIPEILTHYQFLTHEHAFEIDVRLNYRMQLKIH